MAEELAPTEQDDLLINTVGTRLRAAREQAGKSLDQIAGETRIPLRHLESIEADAFEALPSRTYAIGFSRTYARAVGLDEAGVVDGVRTELAQTAETKEPRPATFEPGDPARVPGRGLAWFSALAAILLLAGLFAFFGDRVFPGAGPGSIMPSETTARQVAQTPTQAAPAAQAKPTGAVVFTATDEVWVRLTDNGERLFEATMAEGDTFTVPSDAADPRLNTGRPHLLTVTIGGQTVPRLAEEQVEIPDAPVTATALLARNDGGT